MVFYFTGTGNCLYAARHFSDVPVSIPQVMRGTQRQFSDDAIGIVCPVYAGEPPKMVKQFLRESSFQTNYFYFILTYGFDATDAPEFTARLAAEAGIHVDYIASILMVDNYLPVFDMAEQMGIDKHVEEQLSAAGHRGGAEAPRPGGGHEPGTAGLQRRQPDHSAGGLHRMRGVPISMSRGQLLPRGRQGQEEANYLRILPGLCPELSAEGHRAEHRR